MIYLALSICFSTGIVLLFRAFTRYRINSFQAIVFNYLVCTIIALGATSGGQLMKIPHWKGLPAAVLLGTLFIIMFYLIARTTQTIGVTVASVAQKLSFVVPVVAGILVFSEAFTTIKLLGFLLAVLAVIFISYRRNGLPIRGQYGLPLLVFAGSGACDLIVKIVEEWHLGLVNKVTFTLVLFGTACVLGFAALIAQLIRGRTQLDRRSMIAGVLLGIPNYGSIYFLVAALQQSGLEASQVFPINNVGIILLSAVTAKMIYDEQLNRLQLIGLALALAAIFILI